MRASCRWAGGIGIGGEPPVEEGFLKGVERAGELGSSVKIPQSRRDRSQAIGAPGGIGWLGRGHRHGLVGILFGRSSTAETPYAKRRPQQPMIQRVAKSENYYFVRSLLAVIDLDLGHRFGDVVLIGNHVGNLQ